MSRWPSALAALCATIAVVSMAHAEVGLQTRVSTQRPEVGESFTLQLTALSDGDELPSSPSLAPVAGFSINGPSITSQQQVSIAGGRITHRRGITATWTLVPSRVGRAALGPPSVVVGGRRVTGDRVNVEVVPAGQGGRKPGGAFDPFAPFPMPGLPRLPGLPQIDDLEIPELENVPPFPEELRTERALDPYAFLRAVATPTRVVVGEQVTLEIFAYGRYGPFREASTSEPSRPDFLAHTLIENSYGERAHRVPIDGQLWLAQKVREVALFPIRAGTLVIGPMRMGFEGRGYPSAGGKGLQRESEPLQIVVTEPPIAGRPAGYAIGDVGQFSLTASVEPREVVAGDAIGVIATLDGTGNLPSKLKLPTRHGVEWLEPTLVDNIEVRGSSLGGTRKFTYVVHMNEPGRIDLGELTLPFWDPSRGAYRVARAPLGSIDVKPNPKGNPEPKTKETDRLAGLLAPRKELGAPPAAQRHWADSPWYWLLLMLGPAIIVIGTASARGGRKLRERLARARESASTVAARELGEAKRAPDLGAIAGHVERALIAAIESKTGLRARGILREKLPGELEGAGIAPEVASELAALLDACDEIRFTHESDIETGDLVARAESALAALAKRGPTRSAA